MSQLHIGTRLAVIATFRNEDGVLTNPAAQSGQAIDPDGIVTNLATATEVSTGVWRYLMPTFTKGGTWHVRIKATSGILVANEDTFIVQPSPFPSP